MESMKTLWKVVMDSLPKFESWSYSFVRSQVSRGADPALFRRDWNCTQGWTSSPKNEFGRSIQGFPALSLHYCAHKSISTDQQPPWRTGWRAHELFQFDWEYVGSNPAGGTFLCTGTGQCFCVFTPIWVHNIYFWGLFGGKILFQISKAKLL